jgi:HAE1 family hydrophobic/amphiphilic exporter-1
MTAFSSILGFMPLVVASGAGAASRQAVGNAVVGGMIAATFFSLMFVPSFFVVFQSISEFGSRRQQQQDKTPQPEAKDVEFAKPSTEPKAGGNGDTGSLHPPEPPDNDDGTSG